MESSVPIDHELFIYVRTIMGMVLGLALARLLSGLAKFVQHPANGSVKLIHILWVAYLFLSIVTFWWWEVQLIRVENWTIWIYIFVVVYACTWFFLCALLFPDHIAEHGDHRTYLMARRHWFFGILAISQIADFVDTAIKGWDYVASFGIEYPIRNLSILVLCLIATRTSSHRFHLAFAIVAFGSELVWTGWEYANPYYR